MLSRKAFTLAEFMIVTVVLAILSSMTVFTVSKISDRAIADSVSAKTLSTLANLDRAVRDGTL
ncbi:MAG: prepilin-type N-terminal cleavage/methylation domain-containing protein [Patescibacteria group bacterium]